MAGYTPGPWVFSDSVIVRDSANNEVASVWHFRGQDVERALANARLIAAAPELLEELKKADARISMMRAALSVVAKRNQAEVLEDEQRTRRAALRKAQGGEA